MMLSVSGLAMAEETVTPLILDETCPNSMLSYVGGDEIPLSVCQFETISLSKKTLDQLLLLLSCLTFA